MSEYRSFTAEDAANAAEAALSRRSAGISVEVREVQNIGGNQRRNLVLRAVATGSDGSIAPIIIKATRAADYNSAASDAFEKFGFVKEWAAASLFARRLPIHAHSPVLLASDPSQGVLVFEDLGEAVPSLAQKLLKGSVHDAAEALTAYATALAHLHAETVGCQAKHSQIVFSAFPTTSLPHAGGPAALSPNLSWMGSEGGVAGTLLGRSLPEAELELIAGRLRRPGPWLVLVHGDPCPDNVLLIKNRTAEIIDFEFATPGHALLDAVYWKIGFPTCWCAGMVPEAIRSQMDSAYRAVLSEALPIAADDDVFREESAFIAVAWMLSNLDWLLERALAADVRWGVSSLRNRILYYLATATVMVAEADVLHGIGKIATAWLEELQDRWPSSSPVSSYPAFTTSPP